MILRRLRGILGTGLLWAVPWSVLLGLGLCLTVLILQVRIPALRALAQGLVTGFGWGLAAGALFGSVLMLAEQRRGLAGLSRSRGALWGALAGIWFPSLISLRFGAESLPWLLGAWPAWVATAVMGAVSGLATVWLSDRAGTNLTAIGSPGLLPAQPLAFVATLSASSPLGTEISSRKDNE